MGRSFLMQPWNRTGKRAWALGVLAAALGVPIGLAARGPLIGHPRHPADPLAAVRSRVPGLRVLFIGNSFTYFNQMPSMVGQLAGATPQTHRRVFAVEYAPAGSHLAYVARDPVLHGLLTSVHWNIVVLQEQSQVPALPYWLVNQSLPAVRTLTDAIRRDGALPVLFETWGVPQRRR
jgi:hypothetical protein